MVLKKSVEFKDKKMRYAIIIEKKVGTIYTSGLNKLNAVRKAIANRRTKKVKKWFLFMLAEGKMPLNISIESNEPISIEVVPLPNKVEIKKIIL